MDKPIEVKCYIDDFNNVEKVKIINSVTHVTTGPCRTLLHAPKSPALFMNVEVEAWGKNMKVNSAKTQMLCISEVPNVRSYMVVGDKRIISGDSLKILGFMFGRKPNVATHMKLMLLKLRRRLWIITNLKRSGTQRKGLVKIFLSLVRPVADFAAPIYHPMLTKKQSDAIEKIQMRAFKIIFGNTVSYRQVLASTGLQTMHERQEQLLHTFAEKTSNNKRFSHAWFPKSADIGYEVRNRNKYKEFHAKTTRMYNSPIYRMRRILNVECRIE